MIFYSNKIIWIYEKIKLFNCFANKNIYSIEENKINSSNLSIHGELICFIPIFGEEELNILNGQIIAVKDSCGI